MMPTSLRVVVFSALPRDSGSALRARYLAASLERAGASVTLLRGIRSLPFGLHYPLSMILYLRAVAIRCDVAIGLKPLPNVTLVLLAKRWQGTFTVLDIDDNDFGFRSGPIAWVNRLLQMPFPRRFDLVTCHAPALRDFIVSTFGVAPSRLCPLPQAVDTAIFRRADAARKRENVRAALRLDDRPVLAYPAHLNIASEFSAVLDIAAAVHARLPAVRLLVIGGGPLERRCRQLVRNRKLVELVVFTGHLPPERVVDHLLASDVGVVYYRDVDVNRYRQSMKLREMLAVGLPVVCNRVGELADFASYTYQGDNTPESVADAIVRLLGGDGDDRACRAAEFVHRAMRWADTGARLLQTLEQRSRMN